MAEESTEVIGRQGAEGVPFVKSDFDFGLITVRII